MTSTATEGLQEQLLSAVRKSQDVTLDAIKTAIDAASRVTRKIPAVNLPFEGKIPAPGSVVSGAYSLAEKLLAEQRKFAGDVLKATAALRPSAATDTANSDTVGDTVSDDAVSDDAVTREPTSQETSTTDTLINDTATSEPASDDTAGQHVKE